MSSSNQWSSNTLYQDTTVAISRYECDNGINEGWANYGPWAAEYIMRPVGMNVEVQIKSNQFKSVINLLEFY